MGQNKNTKEKTLTILAVLIFSSYELLNDSCANTITLDTEKLMSNKNPQTLAGWNFKNLLESHQ